MTSKNSLPIYENGQFAVYKEQLGKSTGYAVYEVGITHSIRVIRIWIEGERGLQRAIKEADKRAKATIDQAPAWREEFNRLWDNQEDIMFSEALEARYTGVWGWNPRHKVKFEQFISQVEAAAYARGRADMAKELADIVEKMGYKSGPDPRIYVPSGPSVKQRSWYNSAIADVHMMIKDLTIE